MAFEAQVQSWHTVMSAAFHQPKQGVRPGWIQRVRIETLLNGSCCSLIAKTLNTGRPLTGAIDVISLPCPLFYSFIL